jgi:hypothetical protein
MATDPKPTPPPVKQRVLGIRIFTYPKVIFIFPTLVAALICAVGMKIVERRESHDAAQSQPVATVEGVPSGPSQAQANAPMSKRDRFLTPKNLMGVLFLGIFAFNLLIMAIDFPRFSVFGLGLLILLILFILLWVGAAFEFELLGFVRDALGNVYAYANSGFYFLVALILTVLLVIIYLTRWLDYWQILPNEILHHHGPWSDLERFPTTNLKFDKEVPDVFELLILGAGRLVLHVTEERKAIVLDNVLFINAKEEALKKMMSRLDVRVTTDQEIAEP